MLHIILATVRVLHQGDQCESMITEDHTNIWTGTGLLKVWNLGCRLEQGFKLWTGTGLGLDWNRAFRLHTGQDVGWTGTGL